MSVSDEIEKLRDAIGSLIETSIIMKLIMDCERLIEDVKDEV